MNNKLHTLLTRKALAYTWRQLAQRAGVTGGNPQGTGFEPLGIPVYYANPDQVQPEQPSIIVVPCAEEASHKLLERPQNSLDWLPAREVIPNGAQLPFDDSIPVLFWGEGYEEGNQPFAQQRNDGSIVFYADIVAVTFFMLTRWEETVVPTRDMHDRFPATASVAYKQGFLDRAIVDEYGLILRAWLKALLPNWEPQRGQFSVKLSHDIDFVQRFPNLYGAMRRLGGDFVKRRSLSDACKTIKDAYWQLTAPEKNSYFQGIYWLADLSRKYGLKSAFYFMAAEQGDPFSRSGYDPRVSWVRQGIEELQSQGFEIGFHPSYYTLNAYERLAAEKEKLDAVLGNLQYGGRQHYLRFQLPNTWRQWEQVGLSYDSTLGYADHEGFRCGTCHAFRPFDVEQERELDLLEVPLIVMDATLRQYRMLTPEQGAERIGVLARRCKQVEGAFTLLWHNSSLDGEWHPWRSMFRRVMGTLAKIRGVS